MEPSKRYSQHQVRATRIGKGVNLAANSPFQDRGVIIEETEAEMVMSNSSAAAGASHIRPSEAEILSQPDLLEQLRNDVNSSNLMDSQALESSPEP